jgi:hypothetical protein
MNHFAIGFHGKGKTGWVFREVEELRIRRRKCVNVPGRPPPVRFKVLAVHRIEAIAPSLLSVLEPKLATLVKPDHLNEVRTILVQNGAVR